jgi:hypothetical protein
MLEFTLLGETRDAQEGEALNKGEPTPCRRDIALDFLNRAKELASQNGPLESRTS